MKYLRAVISSDMHSQNPLYKRDYQVQDVCAPLVRAFANSLATLGVLFHKENYKAYVTPGYGSYSQQAGIKDEIQIKQGDAWINLDIDEPAQPHKPIDFFSIYIIPKEDILQAKDSIIIISLRDRKLAYRTQVLVEDLDYFWRRIERALGRVGPLGQREQLHRKLYARNDDQANFGPGEMIAWEQDAADLIQLMPVEISSPPLSQKSFGDFIIFGAKKLVRGKLVDDTSLEMEEPVSLLDEDTPVPSSGSLVNTQADVRILIAQATLEQLQQIARSGARVEQGGSLVGHVFEESTTHGSLVEITNYIPAEGAVANEIELRYTYESWQHQTALLKEQFPDKRIVGWYHTHLDMVKKTFRMANQETYSSPIFFSKDDHFTHRQFFREKWYVAMVLDPEGNLTFFQWIGDEIGECNKFYVIAPGKEDK